MRMAIPLVLVIVAAAGCEGMRFVVEAVPSEDALVETVVQKDRQKDRGRGWGDAKVALIDVRGLMIDGRQSGLLSDTESPVSRLSEAMTRARSDSQVKAVILRINSPGGTVTASALMYGEVMRFKEATKKPVIVLMSEVAASGGYYLSCAGDEVIAQPTTITGSIGVIIQTFNFSDGMSRIGIRGESITSGPNKAVGSPFEPMSPEHRALLQGIVDEFYDGFRTLVVESRPELNPDDVAMITDGRIVTGNTAAKYGLVDRTGDLQDAFAAAKSRAGISGAKLVKYHRPLEHVASPYATTPAPVGGSEINVLQLNVGAGSLTNPMGFYYLWDPTVW